jgi:hypothetical protein
MIDLENRDRIYIESKPEESYIPAWLDFIFFLLTRK